MRVLTLIHTTPLNSFGSMAQYALWVEEAIRRMTGRTFEVKTCDFFDPAGGDSMRRHHLWRIKNSRRFFAAHPADLYHLLDGSMAAFLPSNVWKNTVVTVHDLIPLLQMQKRLSGSPGPVGRILIQRMKRVLKHAAGLAAVSSHTALDLQAAVGRNDITVLHNPVRPLPEPDDSMNLPPRYLFHIGNNADYKNRMGVLDVFARLQDIEDLHLIMAGPEPSAEMIRKATGLARVRFVVNPSDAELSDLYKKASAFLFPSFYEGFGLPVLEAMQAGCPVVCSNAASLPEVAGDAALTAAPGDPAAFADQCRKILNDATLRASLVEQGAARAKQFSMERFAGSLERWITGCLAGVMTDAV